MANAETTAVYFPVTRPDGSQHQLTGIYYLAAADAAPAALLLHGIPGSEQNHDLAQYLRAQGWHVLVLHFSGAWGSGGPYNPTEQPLDVRATLDYMLSEAAPRPIDPAYIVLVGYSLGSYAALTTALQDPRVGAVVSISGFADLSEVMIETSFFEAVVPLLNGATAEGVAAHIRTLGKGVQPIEAVAQIAPRPVLVVHGTADETVPAYNAGAFSGPNVRHLTVDGANHTYASHRQQLIGAVSGFLSAWLADPSV